MNRVLKFFRDEGGGSLVEFAFVFTFLFLPLMYGALEFGRGLYIKSTITAAAREGVRYAIVHGSASGATVADTTLIRSYVNTRTLMSPLTIATTFNPANTNTPGSLVKVQVSYSYTPVVGNFSARLGSRIVTIPLLSARTITSASQQVIAF
jgi:Flp pilus assembly protein TadG